MSKEMSSVPVGAIFAFPSLTIPSGYMPCEGQELVASQYPELFSLIGYTYGGSGKIFRLPDLQGQFIRGLDNEGSLDLDASGNLRKIGSIQEDALQGHIHSVESCSVNGIHRHRVSTWTTSIQEANTFYSQYHYSFVKDYSSSVGAGNQCWTDYDGNHMHEIKLGDAINSTFGRVRVASETRPTNVAMIFCIKVK